MTTPITELALLNLNPSTTPSTAATFLQRVRTITEAWTCRPGTVRFFRSAADPRAVYLVGQWASLAEHTGSFILSDGNQELLREGAGLLELGLFLHFDADACSLLLLLRDAPRVEVVRYILHEGAGSRNVVNGAWARVVEGCGVEEKRVVGGWRLDGLEGDGTAGEFVLFSGYGADGDHVDCRGNATRVFDAEIRDCVLRREVIRAVEVYPARGG